MSNGHRGREKRNKDNVIIKIGFGADYFVQESFQGWPAKLLRRRYVLLQAAFMKDLFENLIKVGRVITLETELGASQIAAALLFRLLL